jgi:hypothetical protein
VDYIALFYKINKANAENSTHKKAHRLLVSKLVSCCALVSKNFLKCPSLLAFAQLWSFYCGPDGKFVNQTRGPQLYLTISNLTSK